MNKSFKDYLWDAWCVGSVVGIWPRFIEPTCIDFKQLSIKLPGNLQSLRILHFSDLHLHPDVSDRFLAKILRYVKDAQPDLIVFTGDFLCYSKMSDGKRLEKFLNEFSAPCGCFAIFGNHDYDQSISISPSGDYDVVESTTSNIAKGFGRLFKTTTLTKQMTDRAKQVKPHAELLSLLAKTPFQILDNHTCQISWNDSYFNLTGLGEYMAGKMDPQKAFSGYDSQYPGIVLVHNPDGVPHLKDFPGDLFLCGHTHGGQVNLPWMWKRFTLLENMDLKKGLMKKNDRWLYVNKGIGSIIPFRWFAMPELTLLEVQS